MRQLDRTTKILLAVLGVAACGQPAPEALPQPVAAAIAGLAAECTRVGGIPHTDRAVKRGDFNGDGRDDYLLFAGWISCENAASIYGDRESAVAVFVGHGTGAAPVFEDSVYDATIEAEAGRQRVWLTVAAQRCGRDQAVSFTAESFCMRTLVWDSARGRFELGPISAARVIK